MADGPKMMQVEPIRNEADGQARSFVAEVLTPGWSVSVCLKLIIPSSDSQPVNRIKLLVIIGLYGGGRGIRSFRSC